MNNQTEGERLRDEGHAKVIKHDRSWHEKAMAQLWKWRAIPIDYPYNYWRAKAFTCENIRVEMTCALKCEPAHPNAWGALIRAAAKAGIIEDTGRSVKASNASAHARRLPVWRFK